MTGLTLSRRGTPAPRLTPLLALRDFGGVAKRNLLRSVRTPQMLLYAVQPIMMLLLFRYVLGGAIKVAGGDYTDFVVPSIFLLTVLVGAMPSAIAIAEDLKSGLVDRFRSLPMARSAVLTGRSLTDLIRSVISLAIMVGLGVAVGFRFHSDAGRIVVGLLLILAFGYAFSWMNTAIGISAGDLESAQNASTGPTFLLLFASNALVPTSTLPGWLQPFARDQPLGVTTSAVRELFEGGAAAHDAWVSLAWSAGITVVCYLTSYALYQRAAAR
jgi:ABC-2 type transport system permease protein/oleandomycin transport system permease protein